MWKKYYIRHQMLVKAIAVYLAVLILVLVGILPMIGKIQSSTAKIATRSKEQKTLSEKVVLLSQIDKEVLKERAQVIKRALPEKKDVIEYLGAIDGLSRELGLSFGGITLAPGDVSLTESANKKKAKTVGALQILDTDVKITGSKSGIYTFLKLVEQTLPLMQVTDVKITPTGTDNFTLSLSLGMLWAPYLSGDVKGAVSLFSEKEEVHFQTLSEYKKYFSAEEEGMPESEQLPAERLDLFSSEGL